MPIKTDGIFITNVPVIAKQKLFYIAKQKNGITVSGLLKNIICSKIIKEYEEKYGTISEQQLAESPE